MKSSQRGFTLIELMIYVGLTAVIIGLFAGILITTTRIQGEQSSSAQVTQELNFLMTSIKRYLAESISFDVESSTEVRFENNNNTSVTVTYGAENKVVDLIEQAGVESPVTTQLSSAKIKIDDIEFVDIRQGSSTALYISITASASTTDPSRQATRTLESTVSSLTQEL